MRTAAGVGQRPLADLVAALGGERPTPAGGTAAAATVALAAGLVGKCARKAVGRVADAEEVRARAGDWERRAMELADEDAATFDEVLRARREGAPPSVLADAADPLLELAALGVEVAAAAADLAARGKPWLRGDAHTAALLAESATRAAATLAGIDLAKAGTDDGRRARARWLAAAAGQSRTQAEAAVARSRR